MNTLRSCASPPREGKYSSLVRAKSGASGLPFHPALIGASDSQKKPRLQMLRGPALNVSRVAYIGAAKLSILFRKFNRNSAIGKNARFGQMRNCGCLHRKSLRNCMKGTKREPLNCLPDSFQRAFAAGENREPAAAKPSGIRAHAFPKEVIGIPDLRTRIGQSTARVEKPAASLR